MDATAWLWAGALSLVAFVMGAKVGYDYACRVFARMLIEFGLWPIYEAASAEWQRRRQ